MGGARERGGRGEGEWRESQNENAWGMDEGLGIAQRNMRFGQQEK